MGQRTGLSARALHEPPHALARHILVESSRSRWALRNGLQTEDIMTPNSMKFLMATTVLAGFAIFALDAAQAGPNGGPSSV
jgi:hypothetical protein